MNPMSAILGLGLVATATALALEHRRVRSLEADLAEARSVRDAAQQFAETLLSDLGEIGECLANGRVREMALRRRLQRIGEPVEETVPLVSAD